MPRALWWPSGGAVSYERGTPVYDCGKVRKRAGTGVSADARALYVLTTAERGGGNLNYFKDFRNENGSSQDQNLAVTVLYVPNLAVTVLSESDCLVLIWL